MKVMNISGFSDEEDEFFWVWWWRGWIL